MPVSEHKFTFSSQTFRQSLLSIDEYFYLTVPKVGTFAAFDDYECIYSCLRNTLCWSVNWSASKGTDGKLWCELLSSHKYEFPEDFRENRTSHHVSIQVGHVGLLTLTWLLTVWATVNGFIADVSSVYSSSFALTKGKRSKLQLWNHLRRPIYIINLVDIIKLPCYPHRGTTTVSFRDLPPLFIFTA